MSILKFKRITHIALYLNARLSDKRLIIKKYVCLCLYQSKVESLVINNNLPVKSYLKTENETILRGS